MQSCYIDALLCFAGRFDLDKVEFNCSACHYFWSPRSLESVIRLGFWLGRPCNVIHIFDVDLFRQWDLMQKRMPGVSERSFLKSLEDYSSEKGRVHYSASKLKILA